eukprot:scaffold25623_cov101-Isochrysis_galbana.AAC.3
MAPTWRALTASSVPRRRAKLILPGVVARIVAVYRPPPWLTISAGCEPPDGKRKSAAENTRGSGRARRVVGSSCSTASPSLSQAVKATLRSSPTIMGNVQSRMPSAGDSAAEHGMPRGTQPHTVCRAEVTARTLVLMPTKMWLHSAAAESPTPPDVSARDAALKITETFSAMVPLRCGRETMASASPGTNAAVHAE